MSTSTPRALRMHLFLVERYVPSFLRNAMPAAARRMHAAAVEVGAEGIPVRHLYSIVVPEDETCFSVFEAPSADAVRLVEERAGLSHQRIVRAHIWADPTDT